MALRPGRGTASGIGVFAAPAGDSEDGANVAAEVGLGPDVVELAVPLADGGVGVVAVEVAVEGAVVAPGTAVVAAGTEVLPGAPVVDDGAEVVAEVDVGVVVVGEGVVVVDGDGGAGVPGAAVVGGTGVPPAGLLIKNVDMKPRSSWLSTWQCMTVSPAKVWALNLMVVVPERIGIVSRHSPVCSPKLESCVPPVPAKEVITKWFT